MASHDVVLTMTSFAGGVPNVPAVGSKCLFIVDGTWVAGDRITTAILIGSTTYTPMGGVVMGATPVHGMVFKGQVMLCAGDKLLLGGIGLPTGWDYYHAGFGYITMSENSDNVLATKAVASYAGKIALFARNAVQLWQWNADPAQWKLIQLLQNTGTLAPRSVVSFGEIDVFYLSDSGVRSLRAREFTDLVNVADVGTRLDDAVSALVSAGTEEHAIGYYDQRDGRYWLLLTDRVYVFSYFPTDKVSAWSQRVVWYPTSQFTGVALYHTVKDGQLYTLNVETFSSQKLYRATGTVRAGSLQLTIPFYDSKKPATRKLWHAIDLCGSGTWKVEVGNDPNNADSFTTVVSALTLSTVGYDRIPLGLHGTHLIIKLTHTADAAAIISSAIMHYDDADAS